MEEKRKERSAERIGYRTNKSLQTVFKKKKKKKSNGREEERKRNKTKESLGIILACLMSFRFLFFKPSCLTAREKAARRSFKTGRHFFYYTHARPFFKTFFVYIYVYV